MDTQKRYLTYQCRACGKQGRRYRLIAHALKEHVSRDRVPFYCTLCNFRCLDRDSLIGHIRRYSRHTDEEMKMKGPVDYATILKRAENPVKTENLVVPVSTMKPAQVSTDQDDPFEDQDDGLVLADGLLLPRWLAEPALMPDPPAVTRSAPEYVPTPLTTANALPAPLSLEALLADPVYAPPTSVPATHLFNAVPAPIPSVPAPGVAQVRPATPVCPAIRTPSSTPGHLISQMWIPVVDSSQSNEAAVMGVLTTPPMRVAPKRKTRDEDVPSVASTPLLDEQLLEEVLPSSEDRSDPLQKEEEHRHSPPQDARDGKHNDSTAELIAATISKGTEQLCRGMDEQLKVLTRIERLLNKQLDESTRLERWVTSLFRLVEERLEAPAPKRPRSVVTKK